MSDNKSSLEFLSSNAFLIIQDNKVSFAHQSILDCFLAEKMLKRYYEGEDIVDIIGTKEKQTPGKDIKCKCLCKIYLSLIATILLMQGKDV